MVKRNAPVGFSHRSGIGIEAFVQDELEAIHLSTLEVLERTGIKVESEEALQIFEDSGAKVKRFNSYGLVKLPGYLVEQAIRWAPNTHVFCGRQAQDDFVISGRRVGFTAGFGEHVKIVDLETRQVRNTVKNDLAEITRIQDALDVISVVERAACSGDKPSISQPLHNFEAMVTNTSKHCFLSFGNRESGSRIIEMAHEVAGAKEDFDERPFVTPLVSATSPLTLGQNCCDMTITAARAGLGLGIFVMSLSGATSPATLAGVVVQQNAEVLANIALAQFTHRGTPCIYCGCSTIMDMRLGTSPVGVPELALLSITAAKLAQYYKIPSWVGACASDSKVSDVQQAYDFSLTAIPAALAGANLIFGIGAIESALTFDFSAMITGAEQAQRIQRLIQGISIDDEHLAVDLIHEVGPGGNFLSHDHTYKHMHQFSNSSLFDRQNRTDWLDHTGGQDLTERAYDEARQIIQTHKPLPLAEGVPEAMRAIISEFEKST